MSDPEKIGTGTTKLNGEKKAGKIKPIMIISSTLLFVLLLFLMARNRRRRDRNR